MTSLEYAAMLAVALAEARRGLAEVGIPVRMAIFDLTGWIVGAGHDRRMKDDDPSMHGETNSFGNAVDLIGVAPTKSGSNFLQSAPLFGDELSIYGLIALSQDAFPVSIIWTAAIASMLDRRFLHATSWLLAAAVLSCFGLIHAFRITSRGIKNAIGLFTASEFALSYLAGALFLVAFHF